MSVEYDKYYQTENLFGEPYPELLELYSSFEKKGNLLDLGCGQGRDALALARLGYNVTGVDYSKVGIDQMNAIAEREELRLEGIVFDIYKYDNFNIYDHILLNSMFHFRPQEKEKEVSLLKKIIDISKIGTMVTICIQKTGKKLEVLNSIISQKTCVKTLHQIDLTYKYEDNVTGHSSITPYRMTTLEKIN